MTTSLLTLSYAFFGGLLPALLWLWFFNHEDPHPEPRGRLVKTFIAGMITVFIAMALEEVARTLTAGEITSTTLLLWALIEEGLKLAAAWLVALRTHVMDEPVDALVYMLTVALGFAALENSLFLLAPISEAAYFNTALSGGLRFVGATLVHVVSSGVLGALIGASFYRSKRIKHEAVLAGLLLATGLHWGFNLFIIEADQTAILRIFAVVWIAVIGLMLAFERVKRIKKPAP
jgi:RsiW-degrading membrane proteinase PrsW (M82 family)